MNILITGANGFVGQAICHQLVHTPQTNLIFAAVRSGQSQVNLSYPIQTVEIASLDDLNQRQDILARVDCIIHLAARVHQMKDTAADPLAAFRAINTEATLNLARQAAQHGVKRFIYLSSIKVNGEKTTPGCPFTADDTPAPQDPYGISKAEAEIQIRELSAETGLEVVIIRPPLVYGPGVKANFLSMMRWLDKGFPLPLGAIHNRRSLVALPNLVDLIINCLTHPAAANQTFLVSDNEDLSTTDLLRRMSNALGKPAWLLPIPVQWLEFTASLLGKKAVAQRLCSSLQLDIHKTQTLLNWTPPISVDEALQYTARHFRQA
ncbi:SDR family oxidoreductase [Nodularia spumigena CS-584]|jgi:nucleoside-diphosphate-sugar epimerase|uniref:UDP-glucose 4-epimerase family protein n=1 Tax=Nodularia spumigena TaxID=70799 RepID=UPI0000EAC8E2|nr:SDR family oxidoreductase [Nodularia spumigena]EAW46692.1 UDP-glucose 4-epimerase, putative [Nodularia spumigena CCY9414]MDB9380647.1 SDR family oxidoreductase [Nodularia spumigena CS-584]